MEKKVREVIYFGSRKLSVVVPEEEALLAKDAFEDNAPDDFLTITCDCEMNIRISSIDAIAFYWPDEEEDEK